MKKTVLVFALICAALPAQTVPVATGLPSHPFFIRETWYIGGTGTWDYLTMDSQAGRLYIAHGTVVQVVDVSSGNLVGEIPGFYEARQVALDDTGQFGYVSDGGLGKVVVFDRQTLKRTAVVDTGANPRSLVFDPLTKLLFVVRANPPAEAPNAPANHRRPPSRDGAAAEVSTQSKVTVVDTQSDTAIGEITLPGMLGFAVEDENSHVFIAATDRNAVFRFDAQAVAAALMHVDPERANGPAPAEAPVPAPAKAATPWIALDWAAGAHTGNPAEGHLRTLILSPECAEPRSLAIDNAHLRLFAACNNRRLLVLNADSGDKLATLPIGPGVDAVGYDPERGILFTANGGAEGSLTVIRQDVTDSYAVIQTLPTRQRAGTLAVDPATGAVYLVTDYLGVNLDHPGGIGTLEQTPVQGSFQVLKVAN
jgi:DNA-binding beta-propeller fold protein YncE